VVVLLLEHGASVDLRTNHGTRALGFAPERHSLSTVKALVEHGADVNSPRSSTPLMQAAVAGDLPIVNSLLEKAADACIKSDSGETAAEVAHRQNHPDVETRLRTISCP
jgi:hypothetical protein